VQTIPLDGLELEIPISVAGDLVVSGMQQITPEPSGLWLALSGGVAGMAFLRFRWKRGLAIRL
jgi:hypothetical protein